jgi:hypothetical protein
MEKEQSLSEILAQQVKQVSHGIELSLNAHVAAMHIPPGLSVQTRKKITNRVPPKMRDDYLNPRGAIVLLVTEIVDLGTRISHYQYIQRYREHFKPPDEIIRAAFTMHSLILQTNEIYVIMERCGKCLDFFHNLAVDLDIDLKDMAPALKKEFKKEFERHLRERHRIVHAHERSSLVSKMIGVQPELLDDAEVKGAYMEVLNTLTKSIKSQLGDKAEGKSSLEFLKIINDLSLQAVDQDCLKMWAIFSNCINQLIERRKLLK